MSAWDGRHPEATPAVSSVQVDGVEIKPGARVRLRPRRGGDILDLVLAGQVAVVAALEQDYEDNVYLAVVLDDDPGREFGFLHQPGHRFFFRPEEVEPLTPETEPPRAA
jgi:hypothetical protein